MSVENKAEKDLRNKLIRLAHENPELRHHLLPLIKQSHTKMKAKEIVKYLMMDIPEYREYIEEMLTDFLKKDKKAREGWSKWFSGEDM